MLLKIIDFHLILCFPTMKIKFRLNTAVGSPHIPLHPLHPLESSCQTQVQTLLSFDFHKALDVPETLHGVFFRNMKDWLDTRVYYIICDLHFHDNEKNKQLKLKCTMIQVFVHLAGDIRIVRACIKC